MSTFSRVTDFLRKRETVISSLVIIIVLIVNSMIFYNNIAMSHDTLKDTFSKTESSTLTNISFKNLGLFPSKNFGVYNNTIYAINGNVIIELTFDQSFNKIISERSIPDKINPTNSIYSNFSTYKPTKFTTNGIHSLILQQLLINRPNHIFILPHIIELGKVDRKNFGTEQLLLNITCSIPDYYKTVMHADTCYTRDIEFLNSSILLILQDYTNQHNYDNNNNLNSYGASLIFYNIQHNETVKTIAIQNADVMDYSYVYAMENTNFVLLYYTNKITNGHGYLNINVNNNYTYQEFGDNLKQLETNALNRPLLINSKFLLIYTDSYAWYSLKPQTIGILINVIIFIGVFVAVLIMLPERWKLKLNVINKIIEYRKK